MSPAFHFDRAPRDDDEPPQRPAPPRPYVRQEYPKWVTPAGGGAAVIVKNEAEEEQVTGKPRASLKPAPAPLTGVSQTPVTVPRLPVRVSIAAPPEPKPVPEASPRESAEVAPIAGRLIRAARGLLDWTQAELAERAGLSLPTIRKLEAAADGEIGGAVDSILAVEDAVSQARVHWYDGKGQLGVWTVKGKPPGALK